MLRLAGALARVLIIIVAIIAAMLTTPAVARRPALAQVKCVGLYCAIVSVPRLRQGFGGQVRQRGGDIAQARERHRHVGRARLREGDAAQVVAHPAGCPRVAFCGCGAAVEVFGRPVRALWLAANWLRFPRADPGPGMAAVRPHHVMIIRDYLGDGRALVYDANSGRHLTRVHVRNLRGYSIRNPNGG